MIRFLTSKIFVVFFTALFSTCLLAENAERIPWDSANNPQNFPTVRNLKFESLPLKGRTNVTPWAGYHWPSQKGGIANQWQNNRRATLNNLKSYNQIQSMSMAEKYKLSPAEKLDIILGDYNYSITKWVLNRNPVNSVDWAGICEGTAMASMLFKQPKPITLINQYNQHIPLYTSDMKAFVSWYMARVSKGRIYWIGKRCEQNRRNDPCWDVNPGAFHAVLANHVGVRKEIFLMDNTRTKAVWNYPVFEFDSKIKSVKDLPYGNRRYHIRTKLKHGGSVLPHTNLIDSIRYARTRTFDYYVDVNDMGNITGGEWISKNHPDFLWYKAFDSFKGRLSFLNQFIDKVQ